MKTYPIALVHLDYKKCVVVGGGKIATRKVEGLIQSGGKVVVISPEISPKLKEILRSQKVKWIARDYTEGDLDNAFLVIAATDNSDVNSQIWNDASDRNILINVVDDPDHCNFIAPAIVRRGEMTIAVSSGGNAPALSRQLRKQLEEQFGPEFETYLSILGEMREIALNRVPEDKRQEFWEEILNLEIIEKIKNDLEGEAWSLAKSTLFKYFNEGNN